MPAANSTTLPKLTAPSTSSLETSVTQLGSLYFIFLHGIFLHKFIQLPFEPIYSPISTTSCGRTFHSFSVLCVCFELPGSCWKTKKKTDKKLGSFITSIYFSHAIMILISFTGPLSLPCSASVLWCVFVLSGCCPIPPAPHPAFLFCILFK